jgi:MscS family membrane protein
VWLASAVPLGFGQQTGTNGLLPLPPAPVASPISPPPQPEASGLPACPQTPAVSPVPPPPPPPAKFATPRETLKTLYFSVIAYDYRPAVIEDAVACLAPDPTRRREFSESARLAVELDAVLRELCLPVNAAPEQPADNTATAYDADGFHIAFERQADGSWRFDQKTLERIPAMYRLAMERHRDMQTHRECMREQYTDPTSTMRRFMSDTMANDFYAAAMALDLSRLTIDQQRDQGPYLAQKLMFVIQRRGWIYFQEVPNNPEGVPYTWHADRDGRIVLERVHLAEGKDAWLFSRGTVRNLDQMYQAALKAAPDPHYVELGRVIPPVPADAATMGSQRPASVPANLGSPQALLRGFFRAMEEADHNESRLMEAMNCLDLDAIPAAERPIRGPKLATKLDGVLRKLEVELASIPDSWNAPPQVLGQRQGLRVELARQRAGTWRVSQATVAKIEDFFNQLAAQEKADKGRIGHLESARDTMVYFLTAGNRHEDRRAAHCLDLDGVHPSARDEVGPVLAFKLKYVIDRIGRVYPQEIPDEPEGRRYIFHSSEMGRIVIARKNGDGPSKGKWLFTGETVEQIESMFLSVLGQPVDESVRTAPFVVREPAPWDTPGIWLRLRRPAWAGMAAGELEMYQWLGLLATLLVSWSLAKLWLVALRGVVVWLLGRSGSVLTAPYVACKLRPLVGVTTCWLFFKLLSTLDLPLAWLDTIMPARTFLMAGLLGWLGLQLIDLLMAVYTNSELLRPHRSLGDMIVPVCVRLLKGFVFLLVLTYIVYHVGRGESLLRLFTGLGAVGLAASLAAQDILKSFFGTLLLIGERSFKLGDRIKVDGHEGTVEQVGFRSTRLRTPDGAMVTIPNSTLASGSINNQGTETGQRNSVTLTLGKDMPVEQIAALRDRLHAWLQEHPAVDPNEVNVQVALHRENGVEMQVDFLLRNSEELDAAQAQRDITYGVLALVQAARKAETSSIKPTDLRLAS